MQSIPARIALCAAPLLLAGCMSREPYHRTDVWQPTGANIANIAAMAADPHDLIRGRGVTEHSAKAPELAVEKTWTLQQGGAGGGDKAAPAAPGG